MLPGFRRLCPPCTAFVRRSIRPPPDSTAAVPDRWERFTVGRDDQLRYTALRKADDGGPPRALVHQLDEVVTALESEIDRGGL